MKKVFVQIRKMSIEIEGAIRIIDMIQVKSKFDETIYIGLSIKSKRSEYKITDWKKKKKNTIPLD